MNRYRQPFRLSDHADAQDYFEVINLAVDQSIEEMHWLHLTQVQRWLSNALDDLDFGIDIANQEIADIKCQFDESTITYIRRLLQLATLRRHECESIYRSPHHIYEVQSIGRQLHQTGGEVLMVAIAELIPPYDAHDLNAVWAVIWGHDFSPFIQHSNTHPETFGPLTRPDR